MLVLVLVKDSQSRLAPISETLSFGVDRSCQGQQLDCTYVQLGQNPPPWIERQVDCDTPETLRRDEREAVVGIQR